MEITLHDGHGRETTHCFDCGAGFVPDNFPSDGFIGVFETGAHCPDCGGRCAYADIECRPEDPADWKKLRRRVEDRLRKTPDKEKIFQAALLLDVKI